VLDIVFIKRLLGFEMDAFSLEEHHPNIELIFIIQTSKYQSILSHIDTSSNLMGTQ